MGRHAIWAVFRRMIYSAYQSMQVKDYMFIHINNICKRNIRINRKYLNNENKWLWDNNVQLKTKNNELQKQLNAKTQEMN